MQNLPVKLSPGERNLILNQLIQQPQPGIKSAEITKHMASDLTGNQYELGGRVQRVMVDETGTPFVVTEEHAKILDCGHSITSLNQIHGVCSEGHIICRLHKLDRCTECKKIHCDIESDWVDGMAVCPDASKLGVGFTIFLLIVTVIAFLLTIKIIP